MRGPGYERQGGAASLRTPRPSYAAILLGSLALAGLSLLALPHGLAYDPWSWLVWGREALHLHLDTREAGTSVKPLPMAITTVLAPFGAATPVLWLLVARAAAIAGVGMAWRVAGRLAGPLAGALAALGLVTSYQYASYLFFAGMSEPMAAATILMAADAALSGRHRLAVVALLATALLRIEAWPLLAVYFGWRLWERRSLRRALGAGLALLVLPLAWFGTDWLGSRHLLRSAEAASVQTQGGPLLSRYPGAATINEAIHLLPPPLTVAFTATAGVAFIVSLRRRGRLAVELAVLSAVALGWLAVSASMAQLRIATGATRYLLPSAAVAAVVAAVGIRLAAAWLEAYASRLAPTRAGLGVVTAGLVGVIVVGATVPRGLSTGRDVSAEIPIDRQLQQQRAGLAPALRLAGGAPVDCGPITTDTYQVPLVAWAARRHIGQVELVLPATGTVLSEGESLLPLAAAPLGYRIVGTAGPPSARWTVQSKC